VSDVRGVIPSCRCPRCRDGVAGSATRGEAIVVGGVCVGSVVPSEAMPDGRAGGGLDDGVGDR
jgi:hypothetical protein